jgi:hypothetical protein
MLFVTDNENHARLYVVNSVVSVTTDFATWYREAGLDRQPVSDLQTINFAGAAGLVAQSPERIYAALLPISGDVCSSSTSPLSFDAAASGWPVNIDVRSNSTGCGGAPQRFANYPVSVTDDGSTSGTVSLAIEPNSGHGDRNLYANIGRQRVTIHQSGRQGLQLQAAATVATCQIMSVNSSHVGKDGGKVAIVVRKTSACDAIAISSAEPDWIETGLLTLTENATTTVNVTVRSNPGPARRGSVTFATSVGRVAGAPVAISQDAGSTCNGVTASMSQTDFSAGGGSATLTLKPSGSCPQLRVKGNSWITVRNSATNQFAVQVASTTASSGREGQIVVSDPTHPTLAVVNVSEAGTSGASGGGAPPPGSPCTGIKASLTVTSFPINGGSGALNVTPTGPCTYTVGADSWITIRKTSTNHYAITIASNADNPARRGTITVATSNGVSAQVTVEEAGLTVAPKCTAVSANLRKSSFDSGGGSSTLALQFSGTCTPVTVTSDSAWLTASVSATNAYRVQVAANPGSQSRTGKLTIKAGPSPGITTSVSIQEAGLPIPACSCTISPTHLSYAMSGGVANVNVTTNLASCNWSSGPLLSNYGSVSWVRISRTSGTGSGSIQVTVDPFSVQGRSATFTVAGTTVTVDQAPGSCQCTGPACGANMQLGAPILSFGSQGGQTTVTVLTLSGCVWTLESDVPWIQFPNGVRGIGNGTVAITILSNQGSGSRVAHITSPQATPDVTLHTAQVTITEQGAP